METITYKRINFVGYFKKTYYEASKPLFISSHLKTKDELINTLKWDKNNFKDCGKEIDDLAVNGVRFLCSSSAYTHTEKLIFACFKKGEQLVIMASIVMDGKYTMMTEGGDMHTIYEDKVYLRHLAKLNGYRYGGIENARVN